MVRNKPAINSRIIRHVDLAKPAPKHEIFTPQDDEIVREIAHLLEYAYKNKAKTLTSQASGISALLPHVEMGAILPVLGMANRGTAHKPNARLREAGLRSPADSVRTVADNDLYYRAAYVMQGARRVQNALDAGTPLRQAINAEAQNFKLHEKARRGRLLSAANVQKNSQSFGPLLGWYMNPLLNNDPECIAANGHNFYADEGTVIGLPGSVHPNCGCKSGPPIPGAKMVNEVIGNIRKIGVARKYRVKSA